MKITDDTLNEVNAEIQGFKVKEKLAFKFTKSNSFNECLKISKELFKSESYQVRSFATFILGNISSGSTEAFGFLKNTVSNDSNWRVQEILAKAFDRFCADNGYEKSLPIIKEWLSDSRPNVKRAVSEGLRIWTGRDYFKDNPAVAIKLLSGLKDDESEYVRKSAGNALRDISKKHKELVREELISWEITNNGIKKTFDLANKFLRIPVKKDEFK